VADHASAEESYSRFLGNSSILDGAARRYGDRGDGVSALAAAWGADIYAAQSVVWERILVASTTPHRQFFRVADALLQGMSEVSAAPSGASVREVITQGRAGVLQDCDPDLQAGLMAAWPDHGYLADVPAPSASDLEAAVVARTGGIEPAAFVEVRRRDAAGALARAQALRIRGEIVSAIEAAYEADFLGLEAYLVESALAAGDDMLLTVVIRWELAVHAVSSLPGLPDSFVAAVGRIRDAMAAGLGDADGARLRGSLLPA